MKKLKSKQSLFEYALASGIFLILCFFLYRYTIYTLDSDAASELILARQLADERAILTDSWIYGSELRVFYSNLVFAPLFGLFDDWSTVRLLGTLLMLVCLVLAFAWFCREVGCMRSFPLAVAVMLLPLSRIYFDVLFKFTYYLPHVIMGFLIPATILRYTTKGNCRLLSRCWPLALGLVLSFAVGLNGMRLLLTLYIPLLLSALLLFWTDKPGDETGRLLSAAGAVFAAALAGCAVNALVLSKAYTVLDVSNISFKSFSLADVEMVLSGLLRAFGYSDGSPVFSSALLSSAQGGVLLLLSLFSPIFILRRKESFSRTERFVACYYLSSLGAMLLLYALTDMVFTDRYIVQTAVLGILPVFICFGKKEVFGRPGRGILLSLMCLTILTGALHYNDMRKEDKTRAQRECVQFLVDNGYDNGYASFWNGNVMTELSDGALELWVWSEHFAQLQDPDDVEDFLQLRAHLSPPEEGRVFVLLSANENYYCDFSQNFSQDNVVFTTANYTPQAIDEYIIYGFDSYDEMRSQFLAS